MRNSKTVRQKHDNFNSSLDNLEYASTYQVCLQLEMYCDIKRNRVLFI